MSASGKILRATAFVTVAGVLSRIGTFLGSLVIIRLLGLEQVGVLGLLESWLALAIMFALLGLGVATTRYVATSLAQDTAMIGAYAAAAILLALLISFVVAVIFYYVVLLAPQLTTFGFSDLLTTTRTFVTTHALLMLSLLVVMTLREIAAALLQGMQLFQLFVYINLTTGLLSLPVSYVLVHQYGLTGAMNSRLVLTAIELIVILGFSMHGMHRLQTRFSLHKIRSTSRSLLAFALPTFIGQLIANPVRTFITTLLAAQPGGAVQVGLLTTAGRIVGLANFVPGSMAAVIMPILAAEWHQQRESFGSVVETTLRMIWLASLPFVLFFLGATPTLLGGLYGDNYVAASTVAFLLLVVVLLTSINETSDRTLAAANRQWLSTGNNLVWAILFLLLGIVLVPSYLGAGYAVALLVSFGLYIALQLGWLKYLYQVSVRPALPLLALSVGGILIAWCIAALAPSLLQITLAGLLAIISIVAEWHMFLNHSEQDALGQRVQQGRAAFVGMLHRFGWNKAVL